MHSICSVPK